MHAQETVAQARRWADLAIKANLNMSYASPAPLAIYARHTVPPQKWQPDWATKGGWRVELFRAVRPAELEQIDRTKSFQNPFGIETKYFSTTLEGAQKYARMAWKDGLFTIVQTSIQRPTPNWNWNPYVDGGVPTVVLRSEDLPRLGRPTILK
jgi:hypothetical protein